MRRSLARAAAAVGVALAAAASPVGAQGHCDIAVANQHIDDGWTAWREGNVAAADSSFRAGVRACPEARRGWTGLGYVALRRNLVSLAIARFDTAFAVDPVRDADEAIGLGLATFRAGQLDRARAAFVLADSLAPGDSLVRSYLRRLPAPVDASALPPRERPSTRVLAARVGPRRLEIPDGSGGWSPLWVKAVNLGAALPGRHPSQFPEDDGTYEHWIREMAALGANAVRVYTIHPPHFYRALHDWNSAHPDSALWLIHGVWTELPPGAQEENYDDRAWNAEFRREMERVVDLIHGHAAIPHRPGHAGGMYTADLSRWTLGYIIGREWEPFSVQAFAARHPRRTAHEGRFVRVAGGNAVDVWLAQVMDHLLAYEMDRWNTQRPIAYTNWPTLDPLAHPTETSRAQEAAILRQRRERVPEPSREYDNDVIALDATKMQATAAYAAGLFASFHAYPYYPDFMVLDPGYAQARSPEGPSHYFGYLRELVDYHGNIPVLISEIGVPSSRGNAHLQPQGWHHGGHDEVAQGRINARLIRDIHASDAAGVGVFALIDEWFKKNWLVIDFEQPPDRNRLWLNALDPEQNYGLLAMRAGHPDSVIRIDGDASDWPALPPLLAAADAMPGSGSAGNAGTPTDRPLHLRALHLHRDEAYVYLRLDVGRIDWTEANYLVAIDTYEASLGDTRMPFTGTRLPMGAEFVLVLRGPDDARLLVDSPYNLYRELPIRGSRPSVTQMVYNRPFRTRANADGLYDTLFVTPNRRTFGRDGTVYPARRIERNKLLHARQQETSLADWYADPARGVIELRIPWGMLHVLDPSSHLVLYGTAGSDNPAGRPTDGFRFAVQSFDPRAPQDAARHEVLPRGPDGVALPPTWRWPGWEQPRWHSERKPAFEAVREAFLRTP